MSRKVVVLACSVWLAGMLLCSQMARADASDQEILFTVKKSPIEVPGFTLSPGTYDIKFLTLEHRTVEISKADGQNLGFFDVLPITRNRRTDNVKMVFSKAAGTVPPRLEEFFYPGTKTGYKILYPHLTAVSLAR